MLCSSMPPTGDSLRELLKLDSDAAFYAQQVGLVYCRHMPRICLVVEGLWLWVCLGPQAPKWKTAATCDYTRTGPCVTGVTSVTGALQC